jgi:hypothetical protein
MSDPVDLLRQPKLRRGQLEPYEDLFEKVRAKGSNVLNQSLMWPVINPAPLRQFSAEALHACFYESISERPRQELERPSRYHGGADKLEALTKSPVTRSSRVAGRHGTPKAGTSPVSSWKPEREPTN